MAASVNFRKTVSGFGPNLDQTQRISANTGGQLSLVVPKGKAGTLSTRTNNSDGILTLGTGHGIVTGQTIDLYWTGGARRNVTVGTVADLIVPISGGTGTNLPIATTAIIASAQSAFTVGIGDMAAVKVISRNWNYGGSRTATLLSALLQLLDVGHSINTLINTPPNQSVVENLDEGDATDMIANSYLTGKISNPSSTTDATFRMSWLVD